MKQLAFILALILVSSTFALQPSVQQHLNGENVMDKLKKSHFGKAIIKMLEVSTSVKADFGPLFDALDTLKSSLLEKKETEINDFQSDQVHHENEVARLKSQIQTYSGEVQLFTEELDNLVTLGEALQRDLDFQEQRLEDSTRSRDYEEDYIKNLQERWDAEKEDYNQSLAVLDQAIELLEESRTHAGSAFTSFVQKKSSKFSGIAKKLSKSMKSEQIGKEAFFIGPIISVFVSLGKAEELDVVSTVQALNALKNLKDFLAQGLESLNGVYTQDHDDHKNLLQKLNIDINSLKYMSIPQTTRDLHANGDAQTEKGEQLSDARSNLQYSQGSLEYEYQSFEQRTEINQLLVPQYDSEYAVAVQAEAVIKAAVNRGEV